MSILENALLAAVLIITMMVSVTAVGKGIGAVAQAHMTGLCNNYEVNCSTGDVRPCFIVNWKSCYPSGYVFMDGSVNP